MRRIVVPPPAVDALRDTPRRVHSPLVFHSRTGKPLKCESHYRAWDKVQNASGRPNLAWHELRHVAATILLARAIDRDAVASSSATEGLALLTSFTDHASERAARERLSRGFAEPPQLKSVASE